MRLNGWQSPQRPILTGRLCNKFNSQRAGTDVCDDVTSGSNKWQARYDRPATQHPNWASILESTGTPHRWTELGAQPMAAHWWMVADAPSQCSLVTTAWRPNGSASFLYWNSFQQEIIEALFIGHVGRLNNICFELYKYRNRNSWWAVSNRRIESIYYTNMKCPL